MIATDTSLVVEIRLGDRSRTVPPESLAAALRLPPAMIRTSLARLLFAYFDRNANDTDSAPREPTEGVGDAPSETLGSDVSEQPDNSPRRDRSDGERWGPTGASVQAHLDARALADALDDHAHLVALEALVAHHTAAHLRAALTITLARPPSSIQSTRGAYFTGVLRRLAEGAPAPPHSHA